MAFVCIKNRVNKEIERGWIGSDISCEYYPCHYEGMDCTFCYCPFFPCENEKLGNYVENTKIGKVWDCSDCLMIHDSDVCKHLIKRMKELEIKDARDDRIPMLFNEATDIYFKKQS